MFNVDCGLVKSNLLVKVFINSLNLNLSHVVLLHIRYKELVKDLMI